MEGGEEAAGNRWTQGARDGGRRGGSGENAGCREQGMEGGEEAAGKPLDAGGEAWREERRQRETAGRRESNMEGGERRQRGNRWTQGAGHGGRRGGSG